MNTGEIAEKFIRAAEVERASREHVGPAPLRAQQLPYVHTWADRVGWRKEPGDKLDRDPFDEERRTFWERMGMLPSAEELRELDGLYDLLMLVQSDGERRALLAWARSKVGGKAFRRWCFQVEGIHPETGRRRKDRALARIAAHLARTDVQNSDIDCSPLLHGGGEIDHVSDTVDDDVGKREGLNSWTSDDVIIADIPSLRDFSWSAKRNQRRRQLEARKRQAKA